MAAAQGQDSPPASLPPLRLDTWTMPIRGVAPAPETKALRIETNLGGVCPSCGAEGTLPWRANDPWWLESRVRFDRPGGGFSAGIIGRRNTMLPLFSSLPVGGGAYQPPVASN